MAVLTATLYDWTATSDSPWTEALAWTPDGRYVVFGLAREVDDTESVSLWRVGCSGADPRALGITMSELRGLRIHPDGTRILFTAQSRGRGEELWTIDNVLAFLNADG